MNSPRVAFIVGAMLALLLSITMGCENIALIKRPAPQLDGDEIVGQVCQPRPFELEYFALSSRNNEICMGTLHAC